MTRVGSVYGQALYDLAKDENLSKVILEELTALKNIFRENRDYVRLLSVPNLSKEERCSLVDEAFSGKVHAYVLNFLKILTEKGYVSRFADCADAYRDLYNEDNGILPVTAVSALPLTEDQTQRLTAKLSSLTGKTIELGNVVDPACLGGIRLDYDGTRMDDTVLHRLESIRSLLKNTVL